MRVAWGLSHLKRSLFHGVGLATGAEVRHFVADLADVAIAPGMVVLKPWLTHLDHMLW